MAKGQTRWHGFDDKILSLCPWDYDAGNSGHLEEMYQVEELDLFHAME